MSNPLRSNTTTMGRRMAGARALWRANGMKEEHFGKPIIAVVNSFTQFVPGHVHLHDIGQHVKSLVEREGCFAAEFNTIAIDDGIAMGHDGMLYSLPSRELIADSVEYMMNAHKADAMICISNCDKITPGMLIATMRLNIPTIFVSGGPMEAGDVKGKKYDLIDTMILAADKSISDEAITEIEQLACPTCGSCSGMFTANSMNCLNEAIGLAPVGNGTILATHKNRMKLYEKAAKRIVEMARAYYDDGDDSVLPRSICSKKAFMNAMSLDIAMGGSTNTILHLLAVAHVEDVSRAGGILSIMGELDREGLLDTTVKRADGLTLREAVDQYDIMRDTVTEDGLENARSAPGAQGRNLVMGSQEVIYDELDRNRESGCIRDIPHAYSADGGLAVLFGNLAERGGIIKTAGVDESILKFSGPARVYFSQDAACDGILGGEVKSGEVVVIRYEGPKGGPGMQEMLYPTSYMKSVHLEKECALITDGRFSGGSSGLSVCHISPEAASGGAIALVENGDIIEIDIPKREINLKISKEEFKRRRDQEATKGRDAFKPAGRDRVVTTALKAYGLLAASADKGAVRMLPE